jgi:gamma-glutamyltranspeptidase/glutathione hydrolase
MLTRNVLRTWILLAITVGVATAQDQRPLRPRPTPPRGEFAGQWHASGTQGAVVAGGPEAVGAGIAVLKDGGNAVDAAVATLLALTVTDGDQFCFGGEVPIMVYDARRGVVDVLAGQGAAPRLATREYFEARGGIPGNGPEAAAVPAALDACLTALDRYGTRRFRDVVAPALAILDRQEQPWHADLARTIRLLVEAERPAQDRSRGLRLVADCFYRGPVAREIDEWSRTSGGLIRYTDLATHTTRIEEPVTIGYRGFTVVKCGPWTQGPYLLETLQLLEGFDMKALGHNQPASIHVIVEALKLGLADRDAYFADPLFTDVPLTQLLDPRYAARRRELIDLKQASLTQRPGDPLSGSPLLSESASRLRLGPGGPASDTTTCLAADRWGNVVAATPSGWSGTLAGKTGVWLGSRLQSFNTWAGHPNCIEPGKRPRVTLTPTIVLKDARPAIAVSVAGGDGQDQVSLQLLLNLIDFGLDPAQAVTAPRFVTNHFLSSFRQMPPKLGSLEINAEVGETTIEALKARGHRVQAGRSAIWIPSAMKFDPRSGSIDAAGDPKARRHAAAY